MSSITPEALLHQEIVRKASLADLQVECLGSGRLNSTIVLIGERPGQRECEMRMPMVGVSGAFLWQYLAKIKINRTDCYVTNVVKRQLPAAAYGSKVSVKKEELYQWEQILQWELDQLPNVKYVVALGSTAIKALIGESKISDWRGSVFDAAIGLSGPNKMRRVVKLICMLNPAAVLYDRKWEPVFGFDVARLHRVINGSFVPHVIKPIINPSPLEAVEYINKMQDEDKPVAFDIETMASETACIGLANNAHDGMCINFRQRDDNRFTLREERLVRRRFQSFFKSGKKLIAQNATFDSYWLWYKDRIKVGPVWFDTMLAHHTLYPRLPHSLGFLTAQYTEHPYYKDEGKQWREGSNIDEFWEYNVKDCCITWAVHQATLVELKQQKLDQFFFNHVMRLQPHLVRMTVSGVMADQPLKEQIANDLEKDVFKKEEEFYKAVVNATGDIGYRPNPNSTKQKQELFFKRLELVGKGYSTNKENRALMKRRTTDDKKLAVIDKLDSYLKDKKFLSTYALMRLDDDGRIRCEYKQAGTIDAPGRLSSSKVMWGTGMNLQNQPKKAYPMFMADPGYELTYFDLRQAEAKVVAWLWNVSALKENFIRAATEDGFDVHRGNASRIFKLPYEQIPAEDRDENGEPTYRYLGKRCVHGLNYRMGPDKLASVCNISLTQAMSAYSSYHRAFPEIMQGWTRTLDEIRRTQQLWTPMGRRLILLEPVTDENTDSVIAFIPQSTIGDKACEVIYECEEDKDWPVGEARMWLNIHDALIAIHKPQHRDLVSAVMKKHAEKPIVIGGEPITIFTDFKHSQPDKLGIHRWSTIKEVEVDDAPESEEEAA
jgi:DNA polymerase